MAHTLAAQDVQDQSQDFAAIEYLEGEIALVTLGGGADGSPGTLNPERLAALREKLAQLKANKPRCIVFAGMGPETFCQGLDLALFQQGMDTSALESNVQTWQRILQDIEALPAVTVAAISGACLGAGLELALACKIRICSDHKATWLGFPEVSLGMIPALGCAKRLPELIGVHGAAHLLTSSEAVRPHQALSSGLVHECTPYHRLRERAESAARGEALIKPRKLSLPERFYTFSSIGKQLARRRLTRRYADLEKSAVQAGQVALEMLLTTLTDGNEAGLRYAATQLPRLAAGAPSRALVNVALLKESARRIGRQARRAVEHIHAVVAGAGRMGSLIAGVFAKGECSVFLKDQSDAVLQKASSGIRTFLNCMPALSEQEKSFILNRIETTTQDLAGMSHANFAIEAVPENADVKQSVLQALSKVVSPDAILATHSSCTPVSKVVEGIENPERLIGMHFFMPLERRPLVEVIRAPKTSDRSMIITAGLAVKAGMCPIIVEDSPGFLVNRILAHYFLEGLQLVKEGCPVRLIDKAAREFGMEQGPLEMLDELGFETASKICAALRSSYGERYRGAELLDALVITGRSGAASGKGFYNYSGETIEPADTQLCSLIKEPAHGDAADNFAECMTLRMINEAVRALDESVAGRPGLDAAQQIDLGSILGFGFPAFRGGLLRYAESQGAQRIAEKLAALEKRGEAFKTCQGITSRAALGRSFYAA